MIYVVDASVAIKWMVEEEYSEHAIQLHDDDFTLCAPDLIYPEIGNILWKKVNRGYLSKQEGEVRVKAFNQFDVTLYSSVDLLETAYIGAVESGQTVYDWIYLSLAISLDCEMVTADARFYNALKSGAQGRHLLWITNLIP